jgi:hypothetical protein
MRSEGKLSDLSRRTADRSSCHLIAECTFCASVGIAIAVNFPISNLEKIDSSSESVPAERRPEQTLPNALLLVERS